MRRFAHSPAALDHGRYRRFAAFLAAARPDRRPAAGRHLRRRPVRGAEPMTAYRRRGRRPHPPRGAAGPQRHQPGRHDPLGQRADRGRRLADHVGGTGGGRRTRRSLAAPWSSTSARSPKSGSKARGPRSRGARAAGRPWVLDPVGVGATAFRRDTTRALVAQAPRIIRGNASEIMALAGGAAGGRGVDSTAAADAAAESARSLARDDRGGGRGHRRGRSGDRRQPHA